MKSKTIFVVIWELNYYDDYETGVLAAYDNRRSASRALYNAYRRKLKAWRDDAKEHNDPEPVIVHRERDRSGCLVSAVVSDYLGEEERTLYTVTVREVPLKTL